MRRRCGSSMNHAPVAPTSAVDRPEASRTRMADPVGSSAGRGAPVRGAAQDATSVIPSATAVTLRVAGVILSVAAVILSVASVILSEAKDRFSGPPAASVVAGRNHQAFLATP